VQQEGSLYEVCCLLLMSTLLVMFFCSVPLMVLYSAMFTRPDFWSRAVRTLQTSVCTQSALDCSQVVIMLLVHSPFASVKTWQITRPIKITC